MNRLPSLKASKHKPLLPHAHKPSNSLAHELRFSNRDDRSGDGRESSHYALFAPLHYEHNYAYPLVVWLHDDGGNERQLRRVMPHVSVRNYVAAAPRGCGLESVGGEAYAWPHSRWGADAADQRVRWCIEAAERRFNVHADRVFIAGFGAGGTMALRLALANPDLYAGGISILGAMPSGNCPLRCINAARDLPLLVAYSLESTIYAPARVADDLRLAHSAGFKLDLRQYPGGHDLTTAMLADMDRWIMEQVCAGASSLAAH